MGMLFVCRHRYVSLLLVGSYASFVFFAPVNSLGQLCVEVHHPITHPICGNSTNSTEWDPLPGHSTPFTASTTPAPTMMGRDGDGGCISWETQWFNVWLFYAVAICLCLQSVVGAWYVMPCASWQVMRWMESVLSCCACVF